MAAVETDAAALGRGTSGVENKLALLRTHPTSEERREKLEEDMPEAMDIWETGRKAKRVAREKMIERMAAASALEGGQVEDKVTG